MTEEKRRIEVNWVQSMAGALAAVTSAVLLSTVGVAGTLIGAALGSIAATVGSAVYSYYIHLTKERVGNVALAASRLGQAHTRVRSASREMAAGRPGAEESLTRADADLQRARALVDEEQREEPTEIQWRAVLAGLPWKRIAVVAAAIFTVSMLIILTFELITGRSVSEMTGGSDTHHRTSIPGLGAAGGGQSDPQPTAPDQATPSSESSDYTGTTTPDSTSNPTSTPSETSETSETTEPTQSTPTEVPNSRTTPSSGSTPTAPPTSVPTQQQGTALP